MPQPLQNGLKILVEDLFQVFSNTSATSLTCANSFTEAVFKYSKTGIIELEVSINPGAVAAFVTAGPLTGSSEGTMKSSDGEDGLQGISILDKKLIENFARKLELAMTVENDYINSNYSEYEFGSDGDFNGALNSPLKLDDKLMLEKDNIFWTDETKKLANTGPYKKSIYTALAIHDFWKNSTFKCRDFTPAPMPAPGPVGPVTVIGMIGIGGLGKPIPGTGFTAAKSVLNTKLFNIFNDLGETKIGPRCNKIANALYKYFSQASITTVTKPTTLTAVVDITTGSGTYNGGDAESIGIFL